ncbi:MAG: hypothetical protein ACJ74Y_08980 [Bryobacteraceae bacterium]
MLTHPAFRRCATLCALFAACTSAFAVETRVWDQSSQAEFARGTTKNVSIRSDGHISLAPTTKELDSTSIPYLWAVVQDSKGTVYYGGGAPTGATTKILALSPGGKPRVLAEVPGLEIHALAVDAQDRLYAAVLPDAKVYRIDSAGKPQLFFDPKAKYVWAMHFDREGNLFLATGDAGIIYRVTPDGKGEKFFDSEETHVRSMILDGSGNLIVGTEPSGLVLRVSPKGQSFVLYETGKREVTAVAEHDGLIYVTAVGNKSAPATVTGAPPVLPSTPPPANAAGTPRAGTNPPSLPPPVGSLTASVSGGSDVYRIDKEGYAERIWNSSTDVAYAISFDANGKPLVGTGNKGVVYRIDSDQLSTQLLNMPPTQITALLPGKGGLTYVATGNVGNLYSMSSSLEATGSLTSEVLDTHDFAYWGKAHLTSTANGGNIVLEAHSGNLNNPGTNWSPWKKVSVPKEGGQVEAPPARFLQYRLTLNCSANAASPELSAVDIAYLPKNIAPKIGAIEVAPFNYRQPPSNSALERSALPSGSPSTLTLPAVGQRRSNAAGTLETAGSSTLQYSKGSVTVRWNANDANSDPLVYTVEIRGKDGGAWRRLKENLSDRFYAFDSSAFPDGEYVARIIATDAGANIPSEALTGSLESDPFTIDNTPPEIVNLRAAAAANSKLQITFTAKDALSWVDKAEYSRNGSDWTLLNPVNKVTDSQTLSYQFETPAGETIAVRVFDEDDNVVVKQVPVP